MRLLTRKIASLAGCWSSPAQPDAGVHCVLAGNPHLNGWRMGWEGKQQLTRVQTTNGHTWHFCTGGALVTGEMMWLDMIRERSGRSERGYKRIIWSTFQCLAIYAIVRETQNSPRSQKQLFECILYRRKR